MITERDVGELIPGDWCYRWGMVTFKNKTYFWKCIFQNEKVFWTDYIGNEIENVIPVSVEREILGKVKSTV